MIPCLVSGSSDTVDCLRRSRSRRLRIFASLRLWLLLLVLDPSSEVVDMSSAEQTAGEPLDAHYWGRGEVEDQ